MTATATATNTVDISGLDKAELLAALFNNSKPLGMGILQAHRGPWVMGKESALAAIEVGCDNFGTHKPLSFDYLYGRPLKCNLSEDTFSPWGYDRDNGGPGTAARIVAQLREGGE